MNMDVTSVIATPGTRVGIHRFAAQVRPDASTTSCRRAAVSRPGTTFYTKVLDRPTCGYPPVFPIVLNIPSQARIDLYG